MHLRAADPTQPIPRAVSIQRLGVPYYLDDLPDENNIVQDPLYEKGIHYDKERGEDCESMAATVYRSFQDVSGGSNAPARRKKRKIDLGWESLEAGLCAAYANLVDRYDLLPVQA